MVVGRKGGAGWRVSLRCMYTVNAELGRDIATCKVEANSGHVWSRLEETYGI